MDIDISPEYAKTVGMIYIGYMGANTISKIMSKTVEEKTILIGGRKFMFSVFFGLAMLGIVGALELTGHPTDPQLLETYAYVYLGFLYANTADKFTNQWNTVSNWLNGDKKKESGEEGFSDEDLGL